MGMGMEQFAKVVLLPQGDFAAFLRATPGGAPRGARAALRHLAFTDVEEWLVQQRRVDAARPARGAGGADNGADPGR